MSISRLPDHMVEEGRAHPFVEALLVELVARHRTTMRQLESAASLGQATSVLWPLGGRLAELGDIIRIITNTEGAKE